MTSLLRHVYEHEETFNDRKCFAVSQPVEVMNNASELKPRREFKVTEDAKVSVVWSPAPVVYGKVNNNLSLSQSQFIPRMQP